MNWHNILAGVVLLVLGIIFQTSAQEVGEIGLAVLVYLLAIGMYWVGMYYLYVSGEAENKKLYIADKKAL